MEMILISSKFYTKTEATIWANRQPQHRRYGSKVNYHEPKGIVASRA